MLIFVAIAVGAAFVVAGGFIFGHDGAGDHDVGHDIGHDADHGEGGTISIFSTRVLFTFLMGFGAAGAVSCYYKASYPVASVIGIGSGFLLAALMYCILLVFIKQQATSIISTQSLVGRTANVTVPIDKEGMGEIGVYANESYTQHPARASHRSAAIPKGSKVRIVSVSGTVLYVKEV